MTGEAPAGDAPIDPLPSTEPAADQSDSTGENRAPLSSLAVVLVRTAGPVNLGLVTRACANLGVGSLRLVNPLCEVNCEEARKFANHAVPMLEQAPVFDDVAAAVADRDFVIATTARARDDELGPARTVAQAATAWSELGVQAPAIIFGNEAHGLNDSEMRQSGCHVRLPTPGTYPSYNLSHAVVVALAGFNEALAETPAPLPNDDPLADRAGLDAFGRYWLGSLERFGYFRRTPIEQWQPRFETMIRRWRLTEHDLVVVRGMLAQMNYVAFGSKAYDMADTGRAPADESSAKDSR